VSVAVPPPCSRIGCDVRDHVIDVKEADKVEAGGGVGGLQARNEHNDVASFRVTEAECAAGAAAVVAVGSDIGFQVGIEMNRAVEPRRRGVAARVRQVAHPEHWGAPSIGFGNRKELEGAVGEEGRLGGVTRVDSDVGEERCHSLEC